MFESEIKTALKKAGLSEDLWKKITVKTVDEIAGAITQLKADTNKAKSYTNEELISILKDAGLDGAFQKALQSETDRRVLQAIKTHDEKLKKDAEDLKVKDKQKKEQETMTPEQKRIQALEDTIKSQNEKIDKLVSSVSQGDLDSRIRAELKKAGLGEEFATYVKVDNPEKIAEVVTDFKKKLDTLQQKNIDAKLKAGELAPVKFGSAGATLEESKIAEYAKSIGKGGAPINPDFQGKISSPETASKVAATK